MDTRQKVLNLKVQGKDGSFEVLHKIGEGGFGVVFSANNVSTGKMVCAKRIPIVPQEFESRNKDTERAQTEIVCLLMGEKHKNIVKYLDFAQEPECFWIFTEYCSHGDLHTYMSSFSTRLNVGQLAPMMIDSASALAFLHQEKPNDPHSVFPIIHRDIKLNNFLVHSARRRMVIKLADFGISKFLLSADGKDDRSLQNFMTTVRGTPEFMPPEYFDEHQKILPTTKADMFSLGLVHAVLITYDGAERDLLPFSYDMKQTGLRMCYGLEVIHSYKKGQGLVPFFPPPDPDECSVISELKDAIVCLLHPEPEKRLSAEQFLKEMEAIKERKSKNRVTRTPSVTAYLASFRRPGSEPSVDNETVEGAENIRNSTDSAFSPSAGGGAKSRPRTERLRSDITGGDEEAFFKFQQLTCRNSEPHQPIKEEEGTEDLSKKMMNAVYRGDHAMVKACLGNGADLDYVDDDGYNMLHIASEKGHLELVKYLVKDKGMDMNKYTTGNPVIPACHLAAGNSHQHVLEYLVSCGAQYFATGRKHEESVLHWAAYSGNLDEVKYSVETLKLPIDVTANNGSTPLHWAGQKGHTRVIKYLISQDANAKATDQCGQTLLHYAAIKGHLDVIELGVLNLGLDPWCQDKDNHTPEFYAQANSHRNTVTYLQKLKDSQRC